MFTREAKIEQLRSILTASLPNENLPNYGVKNDGMSDQQLENFEAAGERPGSARSNRDRHERVILLKERQNSERIKKLEELKEQALAAARLREEQDSKRRRHFEELGRKDDERRRQAEERRRMLEEERRVSLQAKWEIKKQQIQVSSCKSNKPAYAFGSCTPRLLDNHVDGFLWKSQYNLNVMKEPGMRASSAHDLHLQKEVRLSTSMYEWNQHRTTPDNPLVHRASHRLKNEGSMETPTRVFCGRRKTDLTPTIPIKRGGGGEDYSMSRSTSRGSGRVYSSMTRLDRSRSPGGSLTQYQQHHPPQRPSRSKSTTHLQSAGLKLTRTEILRQALKKDPAGIRSVDASRPPSSMSSSLMTSSTHSQVQMRPRTSYVRKARPASVHVTGVSSSEPETRREKPAISRKPSNEMKRVVTTSGKSSGKTSPMTMSMHETSTIKRPIKKKISPSPSKIETVVKPGTTPEPNEPVQAVEPVTVVSADPVTVVSGDPVTVVSGDPVTVVSGDPVTVVSAVETKETVEEPVVPFDVIKPDNNESNKQIVLESKVVENFESIESAFASGSEDFTYSSKTPEPFAPSPSSNNTSEVTDTGRDSASTLEDQWNNPFITNITPEPTQETLVDDDDGNMEAQKPKIMTEEEAKAALAEKRKLAREAVEKEAARVAELERLENERQRLEDEEADRLAGEARRLEEERLRKAIEEEQKRQQDEKNRKEEEEKARQEKERQERAAAKEAERIRLEMEERLRREEAERTERKRRVEAIMSRTRKKEAEQQQAKSNNSNNATSEIITQNEVNGHKESIINQENILQSVNTLNNNFNNNNDLTSNSDLIDNSSTSTSSTLISFESTTGPSAPLDNASSADLILDHHISEDIPPVANLGASSIINNPLQEVFIIDLLS